MVFHNCLTVLTFFIRHRRRHFFNNSPITLKGIDFNNLAPICYLYLDVVIENESVNHCFHVVHNNFSIPLNDFIGNDFIKHHKCRLRTKLNTFEQLPNPSVSCKISIKSILIKFYPQILLKCTRIFKLTYKEIFCSKRF